MIAEPAQAPATDAPSVAEPFVQLDPDSLEGTPQSRRRRKKFRPMILIRRVHLYSGIFMFPFVLLYGVTGWLFNHPQYFSADQRQTFHAADVADGKLATLSTPDEMAREVVAAINAAREESGSADDGVSPPPVVLTDERPPEYSGFLSFSVRSDDASHSVRLDPSTGDGEVRTTFRTEDSEEEREAAAERNPLRSVRRVEIEHNAFAEARELLPGALDDLGLPSGEASSSRRSPSLTFSAKVDGEPTIISYSLGSGSVSAVREDSLPETETRSFLLRLHLSRTYSPHFNIRWFWALLVDGMVISMVFWGLSGLIMWWQIKRTRVLGAGFLTASVICTAWLTAGMHDHGAVSSGLRNSRPRQTRQSAESETSQRQRSQSSSEETNTKPPTSQRERTTRGAGSQGRTQSETSMPPSGNAEPAR